VITAVNGKQALHLAQGYEGKINLLVSNISMPEMTASTSRGNCANHGRI
jgi:hypothetical protein